MLQTWGTRVQRWSVIIWKRDVVHFERKIHRILSVRLLNPSAPRPLHFLFFRFSAPSWPCCWSIPTLDNALATLLSLKGSLLSFPVSIDDHRPWDGQIYTCIFLLTAFTGSYTVQITWQWVEWFLFVHLSQTDPSSYTLKFFLTSDREWSFWRHFSVTRDSEKSGNALCKTNVVDSHEWSPPPPPPDVTVSASLGSHIAAITRFKIALGFSHCWMRLHVVFFRAFRNLFAGSFRTALWLFHEAPFNHSHDVRAPLKKKSVYVPSTVNG